MLGTALVEMRDKLQEVARSEEQQSWTTEGMATFGEILRENQDDLDALGEYAKLRFY